MKSINQMQKGDRATVVSLDGEQNLVTRLKHLGLVPGTEITVSRVAPFGDPVQLQLRGYSLGIRQRDASCIKLAPLN